jgi:TetR/AcrR family transcriptional regulator
VASPQPPAIRPTDRAHKRRGADTPERILDAAEACFAQHGYAGTTLRDVADLVGIRIPSLYNHFANKAALYAAVLERGITPILEFLGRYIETRDDDFIDPNEVVAGVMELLGKRPNLPRLIQYEMLAGGENLSLLLENWLQPTVSRGLSMLQSGPAARRWKPDLLPHMLLAFLNIAVGHFSTAPLLESLTGESPDSTEALARQTEFFSKVVTILLNEAD